ncbi:hypothetical protein F0U59_25735 [Archangium gephyra]|nr:hypothetical protein F0U59_25735 [Archangium gephyra]
MTRALLLCLALLLPWSTLAQPKARVAREILERLGLVTGRNINELQVLSRVATHYSPKEAEEVRRLMSKAAKGENFTEEEFLFLERVAKGLDESLSAASASYRAGNKVPLVGARLLEDGSRMIPGSDAHKAQCWVEYQFRNPRKYPRLSYSIDPEWERMYRSILENKGAGNAFEDAILKTQGYQKNTVMMMPPPGEELPGFIADSIRDNPAELFWGQPYRLVECKARQEMSLTGNLKAMIEYVKQYGGHLELWIRSAKHPDGATKLSEPLKQELELLRQQGNAHIRSSP